MKVKVYRNLNRGDWSVMDYRTRKVVAHRGSVFLRDVEFRVSQSGRERAIREQKRNVHAFAVGTWVDSDEWNSNYRPREDVTYNPFKYASFVYGSEKQPIYAASLASFDDEGVHVI